MIFCKDCSRMVQREESHMRKQADEKRETRTHKHQMKIICNGFPMRSTIKTYIPSLIVLLLSLSLITSCQAISEKENPAIGIQRVTVQPIGQIIVHTMSVNPSPEQGTPWKIVPNINWVSQDRVRSKRKYMDSWSRRYYPLESTKQQRRNLQRIRWYPR